MSKTAYASTVDVMDKNHDRNYYPHPFVHCAEWSLKTRGREEDKFFGGKSWKKQDKKDWLPLSDWLCFEQC